ncbi:MAG: hypothetical protein AAF333_07265 [Planctomycetota bacterium]
MNPLHHLGLVYAAALIALATPAPAAPTSPGYAVAPEGSFDIARTHEQHGTYRDGKPVSTHSMLMFSQRLYQFLQPYPRKDANWQPVILHDD